MTRTHGCELSLTRTLRAPRALVLQMWSDPEHITHWWGPVGFRTETDSMDFREGGEWIFTMIGPDGTRWPNHVIYDEISEGQLRYRNVTPEGEHFRALITMEAMDERTTNLTFTMTLPSEEILRELIEKVGADKGLMDTVTRLDVRLMEEQAKSDPFRLHLSVPNATEILMMRSVRAPRALVWKAFSEIEHLKNWWGPRKYEIAAAESDFRVGGKWRIVHVAGEERHEFYGEYREIAEISRIAQTFEWGGMPGHVSLDQMDLVDEGPVTKLVIRSTFANQEDRDGMLYSGMEQGAAETYERLDALVQEMAR